MRVLRLHTTSVQIDAIHVSSPSADPRGRMLTKSAARFSVRSQSRNPDTGQSERATYQPRRRRGPRHLDYRGIAAIPSTYRRCPACRSWRARCFFRPPRRPRLARQPRRARYGSLRKPRPCGAYSIATTISSCRQTACGIFGWRQREPHTEFPDSVGAVRHVQPRGAAVGKFHSARQGRFARRPYAFPTNKSTRSWLNRTSICTRCARLKKSYPNASVTRAELSRRGTANAFYFDVELYFY